jgi:diguanylate cyclase (GGDEF)-like protein
VRNTDPVARLGGDEFAIMLEDIDQPDHVERVVQKIIPAISAPLELEGMTVCVGVSIGISIYPGDGSDIGSLCKNADMAMYRAKAMGKNRCQFFDVAMAIEAANRLAMEADLRDAIGRDRLRPESWNNCWNDPGG